MKVKFVNYRNINELLISKPWIIPIIIFMLRRSNYVTAREIGEFWNTRTSIIKRGIWWLKRCGIIEKIENEVSKFKLKEKSIPKLRKILSNYWIKRNKIVVKMGNILFLIMIRKRKIVVKSVHESYVLKVYEFLKKSKKPLMKKDISLALNLPISLLSTLLRILEIRDMIIRKDGMYSVH